MKFHLRFKNLHPHTVGAAERLFDARVWRAGPEEQLDAGQAFLNDLAETYKVSVPNLSFDSWLGSFFLYSPAVNDTDSLDNDRVVEPAEIVLRDWSILNLFIAARTHLLAEGFEAASGDTEEDCHGWACSLFYRVKPVMFRARAREGRISGVSARDTYTADSWRKLVEAGVTLDGSLTVSPTAASDILEEPSRPSDEEPADLDTQDEPDTDHSYESDVSEAHEIAEAAEATLPEGVVVGEDERAEISGVVDGLDSLNRDQVRALAVANGIPRGDRNKDQLVAALRAVGVTA